MLNFIDPSSIPILNLCNLLFTKRSSCRIPSWHAVTSSAEPKAHSCLRACANRNALRYQVTYCACSHFPQVQTSGLHHHAYLLRQNMLGTNSISCAGRVEQRFCCRLPVLTYLTLRKQHWVNPRSVHARQAHTKVLTQAAGAQRREPGLAKRQTSICL